MNPDVKICKLLWLGVMAMFFQSGFAELATFEKNPDGFQLTDSIGNTLRFDDYPSRVVTLDSGIVEIFFALEAEDSLVGRTRFAEYPEGVAKIADIGGIIDPNFEKLTEIAADLVLIGRMSANAELLARFAQLDLPVAVLDLGTFDELIEHTEVIGQLLGKAETAEAVLANWSQRLSKLDEQAQRIVTQLEEPPIVLLLYGLDGYYSAGSDTWPDNIFQRAGVRNLASEAASPWPMLSVEAVIADDPDCIMIASSTSQSFDSNTRRYDSIRRKPTALWKALTLDLEKNIKLASPGLFVVNGPRIIDSYQALVLLLGTLIQN
ncbi:MAG: helical backbone metal receptor [Verrucomicrobiota bacterium]